VKLNQRLYGNTQEAYVQKQPRDSAADAFWCI